MEDLKKEMITIEFIRWDGDAHSINSDFSRGTHRINSPRGQAACIAGSIKSTQ